MFIVTDKASAIVLMIVSLWCLGSWPAFFNVLERRGRNPTHTYLDYAVSTYLMACFFALTLGQAGPSSAARPNFIDQLGQDNLPSVLFAMVGGMALCMGNISMQYSLALVGISLTEVVSASIAVVGGTTINYFLDEGLNKASILFPGVGCFLVAVIIGSFCHASNDADTKAKFGHVSDTAPVYRMAPDESPTISQDETSLRSSREPLLRGKSLFEQCSSGKSNGDMERGRTGEYEYVAGKAPELQYWDESTSAGSAAYLEHLEETRAIKVQAYSVMFGLGIAFLTGSCYAMFSPLFNLAVNDQFHLLKPEVPHLSVYTTFFYFSTAFFLLAMALNITFLYYPLMGLPKSSLSAYVKDSNGRHLAIFAGMVCGFGNVCQFMGGQAAGYAAADAVQALPLVGTLWGVVLFGEYHRSSNKTYMLLGAMLFMFMVAVVVLIASSTERC